MSIQQSSKKSYHKRRDSDELDVFEAARYFSGANEVSGHQKIMRSGGRISLDIPMMSSTRNSNIQAQTDHDQYDIEKPTTKEKKYKQPNSPGGRLANFLNTLFNQNSSKKKKSKSCSAKDEDHDHQSPSGRRKRRSSISHFRSTNNITTSSSSSEFTTTNTPTKNTYKDFKNFLDHHKPTLLLNVSKNNSHVKSSASQKDQVHKDRDNSWLDGDDTFKFGTTITTKNDEISLEKCKIFSNGSLADHQSSERDYRNFINEMDDGADSDSSSDLFELQNYDLGCCYSSGLPVYETTHMDSIKRGEPITSGV